MNISLSKHLLMACLATSLLAACGGNDAKNASTTTPTAANQTSGTTASTIDIDGDGIPDVSDNCPTKANNNQSDIDRDGLGDVCDDDMDGDAIVNTRDNCQMVSNPDQLDTNGDGIGDACTNDRDGDGVQDTKDNCPLIANPKQEDADKNGIGDACQDTDNDLVIDSRDNCPTVPNTNQLDQDGDGIGNACDTDADGDGILNGKDNCPVVANKDQKDTDGNGIGDACDNDIDGDTIVNANDNCPLVANKDQTDSNADGKGDACTDTDQDGVIDSTDNCPAVKNPDQLDADKDGVGDACDQDKDGDGFSNSIDNCPMVGNVVHNTDGSYSQPDQDHDGIGDACDDDIDGDNWKNAVDNCPVTYNPGQELDQNGRPAACTDTDKDGVMDANDNCPLGPIYGNPNFIYYPQNPVTNPADPTNTDGVGGLANLAGAKPDTSGDLCDEDVDNDGFANKPVGQDPKKPDNRDNCTFVYNPDQADMNGNGIGDACDPDKDGDSVPNAVDNCPAIPNANQADMDGDGIGDACDSDVDGDGIDDSKDPCIYRNKPADGKVYTMPCPATGDIKTGFSCKSLAPAGSVATPVKTGGLCQLSNVLLNGSLVDLCGVSSPASAADGNLATYAKVNNAVALFDSIATSGALTGNVGVSVTLPTTVPRGHLAAFIIKVPRSLVELSLAKAITVTTDGGDSFGGVNNTGGLALEVLNNGFDGNTDPYAVPSGLPGDTPKYVLGGWTSKPFKTLTITVGAGLSADLGTSMEVYDTCSDVAADPAVVATGIGTGQFPPPSTPTTPPSLPPLSGIPTTPPSIPGVPTTPPLPALPLIPTTPSLTSIPGVPTTPPAIPGLPTTPATLPTNYASFLAFLTSNNLAPVASGIQSLMTGCQTTPLSQVCTAIASF